MEFVILIILSLVYVFFITYASQTACLDQDTENKTKYFLPQSKNRILAIINVALLMIIFSIVTSIFYHNSLIENIKLLTLLAVLFPAAYTDWKKHIISNKLIIIAICIRAVILVFEFLSGLEYAISVLFSALISAGVVFVIGFLLSLITKGGIGMGDVKLLAVIALYQGSSGVISSLFLSLVIAFVYCIFALVTKRLKRKDIIPFAPFLLGGVYMSMLLFGF